MLPSPFVATTDSSFQNIYEYLAILLGLLLSKSLGLRDGVFAVLGDSRSSLVEMWLVSGADLRRLRIPYERITVYKISVPSAKNDVNRTGRFHFGSAHRPVDSVDICREL